jgi:hypothetical protein
VICDTNNSATPAAYLAAGAALQLLVERPAATAAPTIGSLIAAPTAAASSQQQPAAAAVVLPHQLHPTSQPLRRDLVVPVPGMTNAHAPAADIALHALNARSDQSSRCLSAATMDQQLKPSFQSLHAKPPQQQQQQRQRQLSSQDASRLAGAADQGGFDLHQRSGSSASFQAGTSRAASRDNAAADNVQAWGE